MKDAFCEETHWERAAKTKMGQYLTETETDFILHAVNLSKCTLIMDVGAEAGRFTLLAATNNVDAIGMDIDSYGLKRLKTKNKLVNTILADARSIPLRQGVLDAVFMIEVLDYIPELEKAILECHRTLKPVAPLVLSFGNKFSLKSKFRKIRGRSYIHSYRGVTVNLDKAGFQIRKMVGYNWLPFHRTSENPFIPLLAKVEKFSGLRKIPSLSPWVMIHAIKSE